MGQAAGQTAEHLRRVKRSDQGGEEISDHGHGRNEGQETGEFGREQDPGAQGKRSEIDLVERVEEEFVPAGHGNNAGHGHVESEEQRLVTPKLRRSHIIQGKQEEGLIGYVGDKQAGDSEKHQT